MLGLKREGNVSKKDASQNAVFNATLIGADKDYFNLLFLGEKKQ